MSERCCWSEGGREDDLLVLPLQSGSLPTLALRRCCGTDQREPAYATLALRWCCWTDQREPAYVRQRK